jgi:large subunit ribosomal protein L18
VKTKQARYQFRKDRTKAKLSTNLERPRLAVHRSGRHIYAQVVDDLAGKTLAFASSLSKELKGAKSGKNVDAAKKVGSLVAKKALEAGVKKVRFDRGGHVYHGRVKAIAEGAREAGLEF